MYLLFYNYRNSNFHNSDVIMGTKASQITSLTIVYSTVYLRADQRKHQSSASLTFVRGIHRWPLNFPHKGPVMRKMFPFDEVIMHKWKGSFSRKNQTPSLDARTMALAVTILSSLPKMISSIGNKHWYEEMMHFDSNYPFALVHWKPNNNKYLTNKIWSSLEN